MLARAFGRVSKAWKRTPNVFVQASTSPRRRPHMPPQLRHLHSRPAQPEIVPQEQQLQQSSSGGALPRVGISKQNWSGQHNNVNMENSTVAVDSIRDTVDGSFDKRFAALKSIAEDRVNDCKLESLLKKKSAPICYVWCDPSPWVHISEGIIKTLCVNKMVKSGCKVKILMADWFARMDDNIGGDLNKMRTIGSYNIEIWKAAGMALDRVELVWLSDEINRHADEYWLLAMDVSRKTTVRRIKRFYGSRDPFEEFTAADVFYPPLQCATMLFQKLVKLAKKHVRPYPHQIKIFSTYLLHFKSYTASQHELQEYEQKLFGSSAEPLIPTESFASLGFGYPKPEGGVQAPMFNPMTAPSIFERVSPSDIPANFTFGAGTAGVNPQVNNNNGGASTDNPMDST